jgi:D-alanyl-D-alanine carboxypeptidase
MKRKKQNKRIIITGGVVVFFFISLFLFHFLFKNDEELVEKESEVVIKTNIPEKEEEKEEELLIDAEAVLSVYYNDGNKKVLYSKNEDEVLPIASISKLMTALIVFENYNLEEEVDVLGVSSFKGWRETKIKSVVSQMIVESNNVSAFVLAIISDRFLEKEKEENIDSFKLFVEEMNRKAEKIGLENTFFINPSGLDNGNDYNKSTATELAELSIYILENQKEIFDISKIPTYYTYSPDGTIYYKSFNTNFLVYNSEEDWQEEMIGGKTGTTNMAGQCLLIVFKNLEEEGYIINVILGSQDRFEDMNKLINYARSNS